MCVMVKHTAPLNKEVMLAGAVHRISPLSYSILPTELCLSKVEKKCAFVVLWRLNQLHRFLAITIRAIGCFIRVVQ